MEDLNIGREVEIMRGMTVNQLRRKYLKVFGEYTKARNKQFLIKRIAWRMQSNHEGGLSKRAKRRAEDIANEADLRIRAPNGNLKEFFPSPDRTQVHNFQCDNRSPMPGTILTRDYKGKKIVVTVLTEGFEHEGEVYRSLSAVAKSITGTQWNGYTFFKLNKKGGQ